MDGVIYRLILLFLMQISLSESACNKLFCMKCIENYSNYCVNCSDGFKSDNKGNCIQCNISGSYCKNDFCRGLTQCCKIDNCKSCDKNLECSICNEGYKTYDGYCFPNEFFNLIQESSIKESNDFERQLSSCSDNCLNCSYDSTICYSCSSSYSLIRNDCVKSLSNSYGLLTILMIILAPAIFIVIFCVM